MIEGYYRYWGKAEKDGDEQYVEIYVGENVQD